MNTSSSSYLMTIANSLDPDQAIELLVSGTGELKYMIPVCIQIFKIQASLCSWAG